MAKQTLLAEWRTNLLYLLDHFPSVPKLAKELKVSDSTLYQLKYKIGDEKFNPIELTEQAINQLAAKVKENDNG